jgi:NodT family efflux transporter outer membrane factor (OMF) lipoprotein
MHRTQRWLLGVVTLAVAAAGAPVSGQAPTSRLAPAASASGFWEALGDTTLVRLLAEAERGSFDVRAAAARVEGAGASRLSATLDLLPSVTASAGYARRRFASTAFPGAGPGALPDQDVWESGLSAAWEVDVFGRVRGDVRARGAMLNAAEEDVRATEIAVASLVARAYFALRGAQLRLEVARRNAENQERTLELTRNRLDAGRGTDLDVERARALLSQTQAAIPLLESYASDARLRIGVLIGRSPGDVAAELAEARPLPDPPADVPAVSAAEVMRLLPDLQSAEGAVQASRALVGSAKADYLPRLSVVAGAGYTASAFDAIGTTGTLNYSVGPVLSWAAFDLGRVKSRVDEALALQVEASARRDHAALRAREELDGAEVRYRSARARLEHLQASADASARAAALAARRYDGGMADFLQVLDAERTLLAAQDELARGRTAAAEAYVALFEARAGVWNPS